MRLSFITQFKIEISLQFTVNRFTVTMRSSHQQIFIKIGVLKKFATFRGKHLLGSLFNKVAGLQLSCEYCQIFKKSFFHKTPPVAASKKFINLSRKHQWRKRNSNKFIILLNILLAVVDNSHFYIT